MLAYFFLTLAAILICFFVLSKMSDHGRRFTLDVIKNFRDLISHTIKIFHDIICKPGAMVLACALLTYWICSHSGTMRHISPENTEVTSQHTVGSQHERD